jgi:hypothetical protein
MPSTQDLKNHLTEEELTRLKRAPFVAAMRQLGFVPTRLARNLLSGDRISEDDPARGDVEFADLGLVGTGA